MTFSKRIALFALLGLMSPIIVSPVMANPEVTTVTAPKGNWLYEKTLGQRPGTCLAALATACVTYLAHEKYKAFHMQRAAKRRTVWEKIQEVNKNYGQHGISTNAKVNNQQRIPVAQSLDNKKREILNNAGQIYNWGIFQDKHLIDLIEEFFTIVKIEDANVPSPVAAVPARPWWQFWGANTPDQRLLHDIYRDIELCLMGSC